MRVKLAVTDTYVPKWHGNESLPETDQVTITYRLMTAEQEERYSTMYLNRAGENDFGMKVEPHAVEIWTDCVTAVTGLEDENGKALTPKEVLQVPGIYELITEVVAIIKQGLTEADSKN